MKDGHWIPIHTQVRFWLPVKGKYSEIDALVCHTLDLNDKKTFSVSGYASLWGWSRKKVRIFLKNIRTVGGYHRDRHGTGKGLFREQTRDRQGTDKGTDKGQGVCLKIKELEDSGDRQGADKGQTRVQTRATTIKNKNNTNTNTKEKREEELSLFVEKLKATAAYKGIDIDREIGKMNTWLLLPKAKGRLLTKAFIVNWLNKIDVGVAPQEEEVKWD